MSQIKAPRVDVLLANGEQHTTALAVPDQIQWSRTARARGWDPQDEMLAQIFMTWHALKRSGAYVAPFEQFSEQDASWIQEHTDDEDAEVPSEQDPTAPGS